MLLRHTGAMEATATRELTLALAYNVRHLGGYRMGNGQRTSTAHVRAASLHRLEPSAFEALWTHGVQTIVDLRSSEELTMHPTPATPEWLHMVHAPVFEVGGSTTSAWHEDEEFIGFSRVYPLMLEMGKTAYATLFQQIADRPGGVLFHCSAGKDRTGLAAALLLGVAGVSDDDIVNDYQHSRRLLEGQLADWMPRMAERGISRERAAQLLASDPEDMAAALVHLRETWGGPEGYLRAVGLDTRTIERVRERTAA